ncbi:glycosyltransferase family 21 protein, partial [Ascoidea rubescens DSM 1968]
VWYLAVLTLAYSGVFEIFTTFRQIKKIPAVTDPELLAGVTIIRPLKGIDTEIVHCLESSFLQTYPSNKFEIIFCVESSNDPVISIVQELIKKYPKIVSRLLIGDSSHPDHFGPNPKINNLAKGFLKAKFDIIWVMDSNVWASNGCLMRSVLSFSKKNNKVKVVHHLPLGISFISKSSNDLGSKSDEMFLKTSHAKFYAGFDKVSVAPCVNGKSNLYRKSDIDLAVQNIGMGHIPSTNGQSGDLKADAAYYSQFPGYGIRYFSKFIGEDNMIAIALWNIHGRTAFSGDCVIQPLENFSLSAFSSLKKYCIRRARWLRVRKYMVLAATLLEPTTECFVSGIGASFSVAVLFLKSNYLFSYTYFCCHIFFWILTDYFQFHILLKYSGADDPRYSQEIPFFVILSSQSSHYRNLKQWLPIWLLRETLALPIWIYAMCGQSIDWRGRPFRIRSDLTAEEI